MAITPATKAQIRMCGLTRSPVAWRRLLVKPVMALLGLSIAALNPISGKQPGKDAIDVREDFDLRTPGAVVAVVWSSDGSTLAAASDYGRVLTAWDRSGHLINQINRIGGGPTLEGSLAFVNGSSQLVFPPAGDAGNDAAFSVWDVTSGKILRTENGPQLGKDYTLNRAAHFMTSPDQATLAASTSAVGKFERNIIAYDTRSWQVLQTAQVTPGITSLCLFKEGRLLGSGSISAALITVMDSKTGQIAHQFPAYEQSKYGSFSLGAVAGSPAGDLIMVGVGSVILHGEYASSPEQLAWANSLDAVRMFRVKDGSRVAAFTAAKYPIRQAMWDPKGRYVAFVDNANGLFLWAPWSSADYKKIVVSSGFALAIAPDGGRIAVATASGVRVYSIK